MTDLIILITVLALAIPVYVYLCYPLLLFALTRIGKGKPVDRANIEPTVTMIVSCYNENDVVLQKLDNCLEIDYPPDKLDFIFVSDGSDDGTDGTIIGRACERVRLIRQEERLGKTMGLNLAVPEARGEIVVFSDANAMYCRDAIRMLVRNFNDGEVGYVVGAAIYRDEEVTSAGSSENSYWQYEIAVKRIESRLHSVVGGDGAIYAIRKKLYRPLDAEDINDFVNPLHIIASGFRGVFDAEAICHEQTAGNFDKEARRKQRIVNRSFTGLMKNRQLLNPFKFGFYSLQLVSHKLLRWLVPFFIILAAAGILLLAWSDILIFQIALLLGIVFIWSILLGRWLKDNPNVPTILLYPYYFYLVNSNSLYGVLESLRGNIQVTWRTPRQSNDIARSRRVKSILINLGWLLITILLFVQTLSSML